MSTAYLQIVFILVGNVASCCITMYLIRWKKRENRPRELEMELEELRNQLVKVREDVARIKGRLNGKGWQIEA